MSGTRTPKVFEALAADLRAEVDGEVRFDPGSRAAYSTDASNYPQAGNFGFEKGHYDVSVACAEDKLLPALRDADTDALVLADGFSCRTQIRALASDRRPVHVAQVLAGALGKRP